MVDMGNEAYEVPMHGEQSVLENSPGHHSTHSHQPMDGEVVYESQPYMGDEVYEGASGCDSIGCACGGMGCDSMACDSMGCDSVGCDNGSCGSCSSCRRGAWRPCLTLCFPQDGWASFEYLLWSQRGMNLPPLVTTGGTTRPTAGVLGQSTTSTLFGGNRVLEDDFSGGRLQFGFWLDKCHKWGIGAEYFELSEETESFRRSSTGNPVLARPFFNVLTGREDSELIAFPNVLTGTIDARASSQLVGGGFNLRRQMSCYTGCGSGLCGGCGMIHSRTDFLFGYRYLQLDESVQVTEDLVGLVAPDNGRFRISDRFDTTNQFNGFDLGILFNRRRGPWSIDCLAKLAIGNTHQVVDIRGTTSIDGGAAQQGGLLAQQSNIGRYSRDQFTILPELGVTAGYNLTRNFKLKAGYTMIFWSNVVRPGDQIDLDVNPNFLPPPAVPFTGASRPAFAFDDTNYYAHGLTAGAEFTW